MIFQYLIVTLRLSPAVVHLVEKLRESAFLTTPPNSLSIAPALSTSSTFHPQHHPPTSHPNSSCTRHGTRGCMVRYFSSHPLHPPWFLGFFLGYLICTVEGVSYLTYDMIFLSYSSYGKLMDIR